MNIQHLRHSLKVKWLLYYRQNRPWLLRLQIWGSYEGQRRPSSSFILATLSVLEPQLTQMFPFIIDLTHNPDQIVSALGLNFDPDKELKSVEELDTSRVSAISLNGHGFLEASPKNEDKTNGNGLSTQVLPKTVPTATESPSTHASNIASWVDESCRGRNRPTAGLVVFLLGLVSSLAFAVAKIAG